MFGTVHELGDATMIEISFRGRGGQGVVMASQMLGMAFFKAGMYPQCYSLFGGERRGAPVVSFLRVDKKKILLKCDIRHPDELLFFDSSLINQDEMHTLMQPGGKILINTAQTDEQIPGLSAYSVGLVNATGIAEELGLDHALNTTLLGAYCRLTNALPLEHLIEAVEEMVPGKKEGNIMAVKKGYENMNFLQH
jgi:2-oxoacid:acceptor oxidoreductase gamma subunit (pyruvate/2-ketoisovalerate family)